VGGRDAERGHVVVGPAGLTLFWGGGEAPFLALKNDDIFETILSLVPDSLIARARSHHATVRIIQKHLPERWRGSAPAHPRGSPPPHHPLGCPSPAALPPDECDYPIPGS
jgi:hypothetical protein